MSGAYLKSETFRTISENYLSNNYRLPDEVASELASYTQVLSSSIASLDGRISTLERDINRLKDERMALWNEKLLFAPARSPVRRLPAETIGVIMQFAVVPSHSTLGQKARIDRRKAFVRLRGVCRLWREIAMSMQHLWRGFSITVSRQTRLSASLDTLVRDWFALAPEGCPLDMYLNVEHYGSLSDLAFTQFVMFLSQSRLNWSTLSFMGCTLDTRSKVNSLLALVEPFRTVRNLTVEIPEGLAGAFADRVPFPFPALNATFPHLESLSLTRRMDTTRLPIYEGPAGLNIHSSVTSLHIGRANKLTHNLPSFLTGFPALEELMITSTDLFFWPADLSDRAVTHHTLQRLLLIMEPSGDHIPTIVLPSLNCLSLIGGSEGIFQGFPDTLGKFIQQCRPTDLTVILDCQPIYLSKIIPSLHLYPGLRRLHIPDLLSLSPLLFPPGTRLPRSLREIVCTRINPKSHVPHFSRFASAMHEHLVDGANSIKVYATTNKRFFGNDMWQEAHKMLGNVGFDIEWVSQETMVDMARTRVRGHRYEDVTGPLFMWTRA